LAIALACVAGLVVGVELEELLLSFEATLLAAFLLALDNLAIVLFP
jgi:hypothetical protein